MDMIIKTSPLNYYSNKQQKTSHGIKLFVEKGSTYGFLDPYGAGKTTTLKKQENLIEYFKMSSAITSSAA